MRKAYFGTAVVAAVFFVGLYFAALMVERQMKNDPDWMPPQIAIRYQSKLLGEERNASVIADKQLGFTLPPYLTQRVDTPDFSVTRRLDAKGYPNTIEWPERADIVFLGDSILMGEGVGVGNGVVAIVNEHFEDKVVLNLSSPGAGLARQVRILERHGGELSPDLVVACLLLSYDLVNDVHFNAWLEDSLGKTYNQYRLGYARRTGSGNESGLMNKLRRRALFSWAQSRIEPEQRIRMPDGELLYLDRGKIQFAKRRFSDSDREIAQLKRGLEQLVSATREHGARLLVVLLPSKEELFASQGDLPGEDAREIALRAIQENELEYLDLYDALRRSSEKATPFFKADIHYNLNGNRVVAKKIADWIDRNLVPQEL